MQTSPGSESSQQEVSETLDNCCHRTVPSAKPTAVNGTGSVTDNNA
jgi:hypothetical protein